MGGIGKTVMAAVVAQDEEVLSAFPAGVLWLVVGQEPDQLALLNDLVAAVAEEYEVVSSLVRAKGKAIQLLAGRRMLLVLDDVWTLEAAEALDVIGPEGRLLITTRNAEVVRGLGAEEVQLDVLTPTEALDFLAHWVGQPVATLAPEVTEVARECGYLPLALAMIGGMIRPRPHTWEDALERLRQADLDKLRRTFPNYSYPDLLRALAVSVEALPPEHRERYRELAVFPEDTPIPMGVLEVLWAQSSYSALEARALVDTLVDRSLARWDVEGRLTIHDLQWDYLVRGTPDLVVLHRRLVEAFRAVCPLDFHAGPRDGYFFERLPYHLAKAGMQEELEKLLFDFRWLEAKLAAADVTSLIGDYFLLPDDPSVAEVQAALRLAAHTVGRQPDQLAGQLLGRLREGSPALRHICGMTKGSPARRPWLRPLWPSLTRPGGHLLELFDGYSSGLACLDEHHVVFHSLDHKLRVLDLRDGSFRVLPETQTNQGPLVVVDPHRIVYSDGHILRLLDLRDGSQQILFQGRISSLRVLDLNHIVFTSPEKTLRVWDLREGCERTSYHHTHVVMCVVVVDKHQVAFNSYEHKLRLWDLRESSCRIIADSYHTQLLALDRNYFIGKTWRDELEAMDLRYAARFSTWRRYVSTFVSLTRHRFVFAADYNSLGLWDTRDSSSPRMLEGYAGRVHHIAVINHRHIVSGSTDNFLRLWDLQTSSNSSLTVEAHTSSVHALAVLDAHRVVSGAHDGTIRIWDMTDGSCRILCEQAGDVNRLVILNEHHIVSGSRQGDLLLLDLRNGASRSLTHSYNNNLDAILALAVLDEHHIIVGSSLLRVWDLRDGSSRAVLGNRGKIYTVTTLGEHGMLSGGEGLLLWDLRNALVPGLRAINGSPRALSSCEVHGPIGVLDEHHVILASGSMLVCDLRNGSFQTLQCDSPVTKVAVLDRHTVLSCSKDSTASLWDLRREQIRAQFRFDAQVSAVVAFPNSKTFAVGDGRGMVHFLRIED
jgi:WD40 repeat protein